MEAEIAKAIEYSQKLLDASIEIVRVSRIDLNERWAKDPRVIGLALLCRSITNFRATIRLVQQEQVMEARALVHLLYENLLWLGALRERGLSFVEDMQADEAFNRRALGELTLKITSKYGADVASSGAMKLRSIINELDRQHPKMKKLHADKTAADSAVETAIVEYSRFSLDAVHCSVSALGRHLSSERTEKTADLTVSVIPRTTPKEVLSTVLHACRALMGAAVGANELVGFTPATNSLAALVTEFENNGWVRVD
jgi:hypothetical protein